MTLQREMPLARSCCDADCASEVAKTRFDNAAVQQRAEQFNALGDESRLKILQLLARHDALCVCEIQSAFDVGQSTVSHHLKLLRDAGLVDVERRGTWAYSFVRPVGARHPQATTAWLTNLTDPKVQAEFNVIKGSIAIHKAVADSTYPDKLHREASATFKSKRIVPSSIHGVLAPPAFLSDWQDILTRFLYSPDVNRALSEISDAMTLDKVAESGQWYWAK